MSDQRVIKIQCPRCRRSGWLLSEDGSVSLIPGRPGMRILAADPGRHEMAEPVSDRRKLTCRGRKHPRCDNISTEPERVAAFRSAFAAGREVIEAGEIWRLANQGERS